MLLADNFVSVTAIDASAAMIQAGKTNDNGRHPNINWVKGRAENFDKKVRYDLVAAGNSIHWMEHPVLFPLLADHSDMVATVSGDLPAEAPCGKVAWTSFVSEWLKRLEPIDPLRWKKYDPMGFSRDAMRHERWIDIEGKEDFAFMFRQSVGNFIECQHSQASWSRAAMGKNLSAEFDLELRDLLNPHQKEGYLEFEVKTVVTWGKARKSPK